VWGRGRWGPGGGPLKKSEGKGGSRNLQKMGGGLGNLPEAGGGKPQLIRNALGIGGWDISRARGWCGARQAPDES